MKKAPIVNFDLVRGPILTVWNAIGADFSELGRFSNATAVEACIDADRLTFFPGYGEKGKAAAVAAQTEIDRAIKENGYPKVLNALSRNIRLV